MKRGHRAIVLAVMMAVLVGALNGLVQGGAWAADPGPAPTPTVTANAPVSVVIPELSPSSTPPPSSGGGSGSGSGSGGSSGGSGGSGGASGGSGGGAATCVAPVGDAAPTPPAAPGDKDAALAVSPSSVAVGQQLAIKASGYTPGEMVQVVIYQDVTVVGSFPADKSGTLNIGFKVPAEVRTGDHIVEATGWTSCVATKGAFSVVANSAATFLPYLWWVLIVIGVLLAALILAVLYFRRSISRSLVPLEAAEGMQ